MWASTAFPRSSPDFSGFPLRYRKSSLRSLTVLPHYDGCGGRQVETYKNYEQFFGALREALIQSSPNDANALALDGTEVVWEKYRVTACDAMVKVYDVGTVKHPGATEPSAQTRCLIQLTRSRMRDLKKLYEPTL